MKIRVERPVTAGQEDLLRSMYSLYLHDLSEFTDFYQLDGGGEWTPDYLPTWRDRDNPAVRPYLIWLDDRPVGLALVGAKPFPYMSADVDYRMSEFFIMRGCRRGGVGRAAAQHVFAMLPGTWEIVQLPDNRAATAFWLRVVGEYTRGQYVSDTLHGEVRQRFVSCADMAFPINTYP